MNNIIKFSAETDMESYFSKYVRPEEFIDQCKACPNYGRLWSCPPYAFDVRDFWLGFSKIKIVAYKVMSDKDAEKIHRDLVEAKKLLGEELKAEERLYPRSVSLAAGCCGICPSCSRPEGKPCVCPEGMRYSIESLGGDVVNTLKDFFSIELQWITKDSLPDYMVLTGGLLIR
jgi:predicted metal-binding protein